MAYHPSHLLDLTATPPCSVDLSSSPPSPGPPATPFQSTTRSKFAMIHHTSPSTGQSTPRVGLGLGEVEFSSFQGRHKDRSGEGKKRGSFSNGSSSAVLSSSSSSSRPYPSISSSRSAPMLSSPPTPPRPRAGADPASPKRRASPPRSSSTTPRQSSSSQLPTATPSCPTDRRPLGHGLHITSPSKRSLPRDSPPLPSFVSDSGTVPLDDGRSTESEGGLSTELGVATEILSKDELEGLESTLENLSLEWGLDEEEGDEESKEMQALRQLKAMVDPVIPALRAITKLQAQVDALASLRRMIDVQDLISAQMMQQSRAVQEVERQTNMDVITRRQPTASTPILTKAQQQRLHAEPQPRPGHPSGGPSQSRKESGFDEDIEVVDEAAYNNLIKQWMELQAENRRNVGEKNILLHKLRESDEQVKALSQELYFLRASALQAPRSDPDSDLSRPLSSVNKTIPSEPAPSNPPSSRTRSTLGDARTEHLLLASRRLRTLQRTNPDAGLLRSADFASAGFEPPSLAALAPAQPPSERERAGGAFERRIGSVSGPSGGGEEKPTPKTKAGGGRGKGKKTLVGQGASLSSSMPPPQTPSARTRQKLTVETSPAALTPGASFDDLLFAARVCGRSSLDTNPPMSTSRDDNGENPSSDDLEEPSFPAANIGDSPKRRRVAPSSTSSASWVPGDRPPQPDLPFLPGMHASALDLLALASFGSPAAVVGPNHLQQQQQQPPAPIASSSRLGGLLGSGGHPTSASPSLPSSDGLEPALILQSRHHQPPLSPQSYQYHQPPNLHHTPSSFAYSAPYPSSYNQHSYHQAYSSPGYDQSPSSDNYVQPSSTSHAAPLAPAFSSPPKQAALNKLGSAAIMSEPAKRIRSPYLKWTEAEDELLARGVAKYGTKWDAVSKAVPSRSYHQCRQRWLRKCGVFDHKPSPGAAAAAHTQSPLASAVKQSPRA